MDELEPISWKAIKELVKQNFILKSVGRFQPPGGF